MKPTCVVSPLNPSEDAVGFTGLVNLGNTCFMNAIIQVLANTTSLKEYFHGPQLQVDLNTSNPLGCGGKLALNFAMVIRKLWYGDSQPFAPSLLKRLIGEKARQFEGYAQHDAQEFLAYLLDGLHEDLNRVRDKPLTSTDCLDHLPDEEAAQEAWRRHKLRNDSLIVDRFQGQFRSELVCPNCEKVSVTFDPYMYVSVPIPKKMAKVVVVFFPKGAKSLPKKMTLSIPQQAGLKDIAEELCTRTGVKSRSHFRFMEVDRHRPFEVDYLCNFNYTEEKPLNVFEVESAVSAKGEVVNLFCMQRKLPSPAKECCRCQEQPAVGKKIRRCVGCYSVGYCSAECQRAHWTSHKLECKKPQCEPLGHPFVVSLPKAKLTYSALRESVEAYSRFSVNSFKLPLSPTGQGGDAPTAGGGDAEPYFIKPVDKDGVGLPGEKGTRLMNKGDQVLKLTSRFVSLDWKNDQVCVVESKELECEVEDSKQLDDFDCHDLTDMEKCLKLFTKRETLSSEESWYCPSCKEHREADKQMSLWSLPEILIIQLKRFSFRNPLWRDKITEFVSFPIRGLDMAPFHVGPKTSHSSLYDLYGVVNHHGSLLGGHYTAYSRCLNKYNREEVGWRLLDDGFVSSVRDESEVVSKDAYLLFYQRRSNPATPKPQVRRRKSQSDAPLGETFEDQSSYSSIIAGDIQTSNYVSELMSPVNITYEMSNYSNNTHIDSVVPPSTVGEKIYNMNDSLPSQDEDTGYMSMMSNGSGAGLPYTDMDAMD